MVSTAVIPAQLTKQDRLKLGEYAFTLGFIKSGSCQFSNKRTGVVVRIKQDGLTIVIPDWLVGKDAMLFGYDAKQLATGKQRIFNLGRANYPAQVLKCLKDEPQYWLANIKR